MKRSRCTKIVATLGPSSCDSAMIDHLYSVGVDVFRINMSHTSIDGLAKLVAAIRTCERKFGRSIGILADLQGPKIRIGTFGKGAEVLCAGDRFLLDNDSTAGTVGRVCLPHPEILSALLPGQNILVDDGKIRFEVVDVDDKKAELRVLTGGKISNHKGVNLPDTNIPISALTNKDRSDINAALQSGVDWLAISFVRGPEDIAEVRDIVGSRLHIMAKIEKPQAVLRIDEILDVSDAAMVARGDLGVEMPLEKVPLAQKKIVQAARHRGKPVVVATQMLESMISSPVPTRAEVSDVATAVFEGADAVMLSAESAAGDYPVESVQVMNRIIEEIEVNGARRTSIDDGRIRVDATDADAIAYGARAITETVNPRVLVAWTASGATCLRVARERAATQLLALTPNVDTARRLAVVWGVHAITTEDPGDIEDMVRRSCQIGCNEGFAKAGEPLVIVAGMPFGTPGATNMVRVARIATSSNISLSDCDSCENRQLMSI